jgi:CubicO group peptidase (beta-lactamase class C family)
VFYVGSVSKQFSAAAIALLAQRGVISLDDDVRKYVPELPDYGDRITIRQLIHHTSGLRDYLELRALAGLPADDVFGDAEVLALLQRQKALNFPPGTDHLYCNSGYFLLSMIAKRASGESLRDFAGKAIFQPLGMSTAQFRDDHAALIKDRAHGYMARAGGGYRASEPNFDVYGAGGLFMTVRDFLRWDENFYTGQVGGKEFTALLTTPGKLTDGKKLTYAFGLTAGSYRGLAIVEHGGAYGGFRAHVLRFPERHFSVACFGNLASFAPGPLVRQVADLYLADAMKAPAPAATPATKASAAAGKAVRVEKPEEFAGEYSSAELAAAFRISVKDGQLMLHIANREAGALRATAPDGFAHAGQQLKFKRGSDGRIESFTLDAARIRGITFVRR